MDLFGQKRPESSFPAFGFAGHTGNASAQAASPPVTTFGFGQAPAGSSQEPPRLFGQAPVFGSQKSSGTGPRDTFVFGGVAGKAVPAESYGEPQPASSFLFGKTGQAKPSARPSSNLAEAHTARAAGYPGEPMPSPSWIKSERSIKLGNTGSFGKSNVASGDEADDSVFDMEAEKARALSSIPSFSGGPAKPSSSMQTHGSNTKLQRRSGAQVAKDKATRSPAPLSLHTVRGHLSPSAAAREEGEILGSPQLISTPPADTRPGNAPASPGGLRRCTAGRTPPTTPAGGAAFATNFVALMLCQ